MRWEGDPAFRWYKWDNDLKKNIRVTCSDLGFDGGDRTKAKTVEAANRWWLARQKSNSPHHEDFRYWVDEFRKRAAWWRFQQDLSLASKLDDIASKVESYIGIWPDSELAKIVKSVADVGENWGEKHYVKEQAGQPQPPAEKTVEFNLERWLGLKLGEVNSGKRSLAGYDNLRRWMGEFKSFVGATSDVMVIDAARWDSFYGHISGKLSGDSPAWSQSYARDVLVAARSWIVWLSKQAMIPRPLNIEDHKVVVDDPETIVTYTPQEIKTTLEKAPGQLKLHLLLMLNCGHTQQDISDLLRTQIDLKEGTISRKRSKTRGKKKVPTVTYKLWKTTLEELKKWVAECKDEEFALSTKNGKRWVRRRFKDDGTFTKTDSIVSNFRHVRATTGIQKSLKVFRSTSGNLIADSPHRAMRTLFLGQSNILVADRRYANAPNKLLSKAIDWLGKQYGLN